MRAPTASATITLITASPGPQQVAADIASGRVLFQAQCAACHALKDAGVSSAVQPSAPALDAIGAHHDRAWLNEEVANACAHRIGASAYNCAQVHNTVASLNQRQRDQIVTYLLKTR
jgi:mono/diheme cytochrome c family protein